MGAKAATSPKGRATLTANRVMLLLQIEQEQLKEIKDKDTTVTKPTPTSSLWY
jgi:hypothetical protein